MRVFFTALAAGVSATTTNDGSAHTRQTMCRQGGRSNITHLAWKGSSCNHWQTVEEAKQEAYNYLRDNVMAFDLPFLQTLGFHENNRTDVDGLADGLIGPTIE